MYYCWQRNKAKYKEVYEFICKHEDGVTVIDIAKQFNTHYAVVVRWLISLECLGFLLYQEGSKVFKFDAKLL
jgi:predicted ArsR family transcriptional regulator